MTFHRWLYKDGRPNGLAKILNGFWGWLHTLGISPNYMVTLEVVGRKSGKAIRFPLAMAVVKGERYLVSMLGEDANWVQNVKAASGKAVLRHGKVEHVVLEEVDARQRAPILKQYLQRAPGARPHVSVDLNAPLVDFEKISTSYPVFQIKKEAEG